MPKDIISRGCARSLGSKPNALPTELLPLVLKYTCFIITDCEPSRSWIENLGLYWLLRHHFIQVWVEYVCVHDNENITKPFNTLLSDKIHFSIHTGSTRLVGTLFFLMWRVQVTTIKFFLYSQRLTGLTGANAKSPLTAVSAVSCCE